MNSAVNMFRLLCMTVCLSCSGLLPNLYAQSGEGGLFAFTYAVFALDDTTSLLELEYQFPERGLLYKDEEGGRFGRLYTRLSVYDSGDVSVFTRDWITRHPESNAEQARSLIGIRRFALPPGRYQATIYFEDQYRPEHHDSTMFLLFVPSYAGGGIGVSDIKLANEIYNSQDTDNPFYKHGNIIIPNILETYAEPFLVLNTYVEIYNADQVPTSEYTVQYAVADSSRRIFYERDKVNARPEGAAVFDLNALPLGELPSGNYYLLVRVFNGLRRSATDSATAVRSFAIYNPSKDSAILAEFLPPASNELDVIDPMYAGMTESELDRIYAQVEYIAVAGEKNIWRQLDGPEAKGRFMTRFWEKRDPNMETPENEALDAYNSRVEKARKQYSEPFHKDGWNSDRGRILLQYGEPDNIERHLQDSNRKPYEIWRYYSDAFEFVFVDRTQTGVYQLVHSTAPGEQKYENWEEDFATLHIYFETGGFNN